MTRASLREYAAAQRARYRQSTRAEKRQLLNEIVAVTRMHRKAAMTGVEKEIEVTAAGAKADFELTMPAAK